MKEETQRSLSIIPPLFFGGALALLPWVIAPWFLVPVSTAKIFFISVTLIVSFLLWWLFSLRSITQFPTGIVSISFAAIVFVSLISSLFSSNFHQSFFGLEYEFGTGISLLLLFLLFLFSSVLFRTRTAVFYFYTALIFSLSLVFLFELVRLSMGFLPAIGGMSIVGSQLDLAILAGFAVVLILPTLATFHLREAYQAFLFFALFLALLTLALSLFTSVWIMVAIFSFLFLLFQRFFFFSPVELQGEGGAKKPPLMRLSKVAIVVLTTSLFFSVFSSIVQDTVVRTFPSFQKVFEIRPTFSESYAVLRPTLTEDLRHVLVGSGPNTFRYQWDLYKPLSVNSTPYWNSAFIIGSSLLLTLIISTGLLGGLVWILFLLSFVGYGLYGIIKRRGREEELYFLVSSYLLAIYGWVWFIFYTPNITILSLTAVATGIVVALLARQEIIPSRKFRCFTQFRVLFIITTLIILLLGAGTSYLVGAKFLSIVHYGKGSALFLSGQDLVTAKEELLVATDYSEQALFYITLANVKQAQIIELVSKKDISDEDVKQFQILSAEAIEYARTALDVDNKRDYQIFIAFGDIYTQLAVLGIEGTYEQGRQRYGDAAIRSPNSPVSHYRNAQLAFFSRNEVSARESLGKAIALKFDYSDAWTLLRTLFEDRGGSAGTSTSVTTPTSGIDINTTTTDQ